MISRPIEIREHSPSPKYDVQKQLLEDREDLLSREIVLVSLRKRFESNTTEKVLDQGRILPSGDQPLVTKGPPGKPNGPRRRGEPLNAQG